MAPIINFCTTYEYLDLNKYTINHMDIMKAIQYKILPTYIVV